MTKNMDFSPEEAMSRLTEKQLAALREALDQSTALDQLYVDFAHTEQGTGALGRDALEAGKALLRNTHQQLSDLICGSQTIRALAEDPHADTADLIALGAVIAALLEAQQARVVNSVLVAALIARIGVRRFCERCWA